jgi:hypothetical protein
MFQYHQILNVFVEWLKLLLRIPETGYTDWGFLWFSSVPSGKCCDSNLKLGHDSLLPHPFLFIIYISPLHSTLYNLSHWKALLNKLQTNKQYHQTEKPYRYYMVNSNKSTQHKITLSVLVLILYSHHYRRFVHHSMYAPFFPASCSRVCHIFRNWTTATIVWAKLDTDSSPDDRIEIRRPW